MTNSGFVAGTLVHTDKGLVPIQDIKVGDMVLSKDESGEGELVYKPVIKLVCLGENEVVRLNYQKDDEYGDLDFPMYLEFVNHNQPIWDEDLKKWIIASEIQIGTLLSSPNNKNSLRVLETDIVWDSYTKDIGITYPIFSDESEIDFMVVFSNQGYKMHSNKFAPDYYISETMSIKFDLNYSREIYNNYENKSWAGNRKPVQVSVFNIEVADNHTYYIGEKGIWVHDSTTNIS